MDNEELYYNIQYKAMQSVYWSRKARLYFLVEQYYYAPMIEDDLFTSYFHRKDVVSVLEMEQRFGRRLKIEELAVCPLSVSYLLFGRPLITGTPKEYNKLCAFADLIDKSIRRNETNAIRWEINKLNKKRITARGGIPQPDK